MEKRPVRPNPMCGQCRSNLIHGAKFKQKDPWVALEVTTLLTLLTISLDDKKFLIKYGNDVYGVEKIPCLGCFLPNHFKNIIQIAKQTRKIEAVKAYGDKLINQNKGQQ